MCVCVCARLDADVFDDLKVKNSIFYTATLTLYRNRSTGVWNISTLGSFFFYILSLRCVLRWSLKVWNRIFLIRLRWLCVAKYSKYRSIEVSKSFGLEEVQKFLYIGVWRSVEVFVHRFSLLRIEIDIWSRTCSTIGKFRSIEHGSVDFTWIWNTHFI